MKTESEEILTKYLLGELSEAEQRRIEEGYFTDSEFYEQLAALQNEMLYDYTQGKLSQEMSERFEQRYLSSSRGRGKAEAARRILDRLLEMRPATSPPDAAGKRRTLTEFLRSLRGSRFPVLMYSAAVAALALVAGSAWLLFETISLRGQLNQARIEKAASDADLNKRAADEQARLDQMSRELEAERRQRAQTEQELAEQKTEAANRQAKSSPLGIVASLVLNPGMERNLEAPSQVRIGPEVGRLHLQLNLKEQIAYQSCRAVLRTLDGREVWHQGGLRARPTTSGHAVQVSVPSRTLAAGDYELTLSGVTAEGKAEDISDYFFTVVKR